MDYYISYFILIVVFYIPIGLFLTHGCILSFTEDFKEAIGPVAPYLIFILTLSYWAVIFSPLFGSDIMYIVGYVLNFAFPSEHEIQYRIAFLLMFILLAFNVYIFYYNISFNQYGGYVILLIPAIMLITDILCSYYYKSNELVIIVQYILLIYLSTPFLLALYIGGGAPYALLHVLESRSLNNYLENVFFLHFVILMSLVFLYQEHIFKME